MVKGYPILLNLRDRRVVIVGGGRVAARKVRDLFVTGARITIVSPLLDAALEPLAVSNQLEVLRQPYTPGIFAHLRPVLIFAATDSAEVNRQVINEAHALGILANTVDEADISDFHSMAVVRRGEITLAVSTGGASPALSAQLKHTLESTIGEEYALLAQWMHALRPIIREKIEAESERTAFWRAILDSDILALLRAGDEKAAREIVEQLLKRKDA